MISQSVLPICDANPMLEAAGIARCNKMVHVQPASCGHVCKYWEKRAERANGVAPNAFNFKPSLILNTKRAVHADDGG